ncbi:MAG: SDR family NAD(P)-dependent oxidoreductase, partial [bacterium]
MKGYGLEGRVALVTGGSRGIGSAIALDLAENGADVAITYRAKEKEARDVVERIQAMGRRGQCYIADVSSFQKAQEVVQMVISEFGRLDILVNNAGINR